MYSQGNLTSHRVIYMACKDPSTSCYKSHVHIAGDTVLGMHRDSYGPHYTFQDIRARRKEVVHTCATGASYEMNVPKAESHEALRPGR